MRRCHYVLVVGLLSLAHFARGEAPPELLAAAADRISIGKGEVEFTWSSHMWPEKRYYSTRFAGDDQLFTWKGDEEGVLLRDADGLPERRGAGSIGPHYTLTHEGTAYIAVDGDISGQARRFGTPEGLGIDPRCLGLTAVPPIRTNPERVVGIGPDGAPDYDYAVQRDGGTTRVVATRGSFRLTWELDPVSGLPVRIAQDHEGKTLYEARVQLAQRGDRWYPRRIEYYNASHRGGVEPTDVLEITAARFDDPNLPDAITPADIGIDAGFMLDCWEGERMQRSREAHVWDGTKIVTAEEYAERVRRGELQPGENYLRNRARLSRINEEIRLARQEAAGGGRSTDAVIPAVSEWEGEWDRYVREFIARYRLNDDQSDQARRLLRTCKEQAAEYISRKRRTFDAFEKARAACAQLSPEDRRGRAAALTEQRAVLMAPVRRIFDERLKPGLEKLPTRAQRAAVDASAPQAGRAPRR